MGIINDEMPDWMTKCSEFNIPIIETSSNISTTISPYSTNDDLPDCNFNELSCKYLSLLYKQGILDMVSLSLPLPLQYLGYEKMGLIFARFHFRFLTTRLRKPWTMFTKVTSGVTYILATITLNI